MHAILISEDTLPKIDEVDKLNDRDKASIRRYYVNRRVDYYFITGYVTKYEKFIPWTILPALAFTQYFDHDPEKIKTDWVQIVRMKVLRG